MHSNSICSRHAWSPLIPTRPQCWCSTLPEWILDPKVFAIVKFREILLVLPHRIASYTSDQATTRLDLARSDGLLPLRVHQRRGFCERSRAWPTSNCMIGSALPSQNSLRLQRRFGQPHGQWFLTCWMLIGLLLMSFTGCRQRAVTELYVEQMAQRNRALEDLVYDFDAENRSMEFEIEDLRRTNAQLQGRLQEIQRQSSRIDTASPSDRPSKTSPDSIKRDVVRPETVRPETVRPETSKSRNASPAPLKLPSGRSKDDASLILEPPEIVVPNPLAEPFLPAPEPLVPKSQAPEPLVREPQIREQLPEATLPEVPAIEKGSMLEPAPRGLPTGSSDASLLDRKIQLPASAAPSGGLPNNVLPVIQTSAVQAAAARAALGPPPSKPVDSRVREIDWHPTMCRAQNSDGKPGDDGLYLVLVPRNSAGQFVPSVGALTLVVEETLADGSVARIGRYEFSEAELKDHLEPVGSAPGLHIPIRWTEQKPISTSVEVYAKLTMPDGTTMVNRRTIPLRKLASSGSSTWTPR